MKHMNVALFVPHLGCPHRCAFCDQHAISGSGAPITADEIVAACETAKRTPHRREDAEIAFFGGSFTAIDRDVQKLCLETVQPYLERDFGGIRISTRPDAVDDEELAFLKAYGVTAIELGAQSMDDRVLTLNARGHTAADTADAARRIRGAGFSLGLQMMTGLYGATDETDLATANAFLSLSPDTVRVYPTVVLAGTRLAALYRDGTYLQPDFDAQVALCARLLTLFESNGVRVIRLGLHAGRELEKNYVAGTYHPAFRELVESRCRRQTLEALLRDKPPGHYIIYIKRGELSRTIGQRRENLTYFADRGYLLRVRETDASQTPRIERG